MSAELSVSGSAGSGGNHSVVPYDYSEKKTDLRKVPKFNGDHRHCFYSEEDVQETS